MSPVLREIGLRSESVDGLLRRALGQPGEPVYLLLRFETTGEGVEDFLAMSDALPWSPELGEGRAGLFRDLERHGLGVVACGSGREARRRLKQVRSGRLSAELIGQDQFEAVEEARAKSPLQQPSALVVYVVRSVHRLLQTRFGWEAGLGDPRVRLFDPAAGVMSYLREAWRVALEASWHRRDEPREVLLGHLLLNTLGVELEPQTYARGKKSLYRFLEVFGHSVSLPEGPPAMLDDVLAPERAVVLDFPANVVLGNPSWRGRTELGGAWISDLLDDYRGEFQGRPLLGRSATWSNGEEEAIATLRLAQWKIEQAGEGVVALVLPETVLERATLQGVRRALLESFDEVYALNLHGKRSPRTGSGARGVDENVFPSLAYGVAVLFLVKRRGLPKRVLHADLYGRRREKLRSLAAMEVSTARWEEYSPRPAGYIYSPEVERREREYLGGLSLAEIFPLVGTGLNVGKRGIAMGLGDELLARPNQGRALSILASPFDRRFVFYREYAKERAEHPVLRHLENGGNLALLVSRHQRGEAGVFATRWIAGERGVTGKEMTSVFPLWLCPQGKGPAARRGRTPNLAPELLLRLGERYGLAASPEGLLGYVYAVLYDPSYRARYRRYMNGEFPRIPFPQEEEVFVRLSTLGKELLGLHLLSDRRLLDPPIGIERGESLKLGAGSRSFLNYWGERGRLLVNRKGLVFTGISPEVYSFSIGGNPVLRRWLRARTGRVLSAEEILSFRRIAAALTLTLDWQARIADIGWDYGDPRL